MPDKVVSENSVPLRDGLTPAEYRQVECHCSTMANRMGHDVSFAEGKTDWLATCAADWRRQRQEHMLALQREEIAKHRWIESQKAGYDLGRQVALEWVIKHAAKWRKWYEETFVAGPGDFPHTGVHGQPR